MASDRTVVWRPLLWRGSDQCTLWRDGSGWHIEGIVLATLPGAPPAQVSYAIRCAPDWTTREATADVRMPAERRFFHVRARDGRWTVNGHAQEALRGCVDVDFGFTPATNTLPIRRLALAPGDSCDLVAAWMRFPEMTVEALPQRYTRLEEDRYRYESGTGFAAEVLVDEAGLVRDYAGVWQRIR
jgi:hypothetical protein